MADSVAADPRPAVLYLRAFQLESEPFVCVLRKELPRYTRRPYGMPSVTFEQYLGVTVPFAPCLAPVRVRTIPAGNFGIIDVRGFTRSRDKSVNTP